MKVIPRASRLILALYFLAQSAGVSYALPAPASATPKKTSPQIPIYFEANRGQTDASVKFMARGAGYRLLLTSNGVTAILRRSAIHLHLKGSAPGPLIEGQGLLPGKSHYFIGNDPRQWVTGAAQYAKVIYRQIYPGIDMVYYGHQGRLEYDFVVAPGADPRLIRMGFRGSKNLRLDSEGNLVLPSAGGLLTLHAPILYQKANGAREFVKGRFVLSGHDQVCFAVGAYDKNKELVIDPSFSYSTFLGTTVEDRANAIAVDAAGTVYLTGQTAPVADVFPGSAGHFQPVNGGGAFDVFVTKISAAGTIVWSTYLGGAGTDIGKSIGVDSSGRVYLTGSTTSSGGSPFPTSAAFQAVNGGGTDAFLTEIAADGNSLVYSTYLGGAGVESGNGLSVDSAGNAYVTGGITSDNSTFAHPVTTLQNQNGGPGGVVENAFVTKFDAAGTIQYFTYLGGSVVGGTHGNAIVIDGLGNAYVTGLCRDTFPTFPSGVLPLARAFKLTIGGAVDAFVSKISPTGSSLLYSSYLGGSGLSEGTAIELDPAGNVYVAGDTDSTNFPDPATDGVTVGFPKVGQTSIIGNNDGFIFKMAMNATGHSDGVYCTFLGGSGLDHVNAMVVDAFGDAYVTGRAESTDFLTAGPLSIQTPIDTVQNGTAKAFVTEIGAAGNTRVWNTYLGGVTDQEGKGIFLDAAHNIYLTGWTNSADFPTASPLFAAKAGAEDAFLMKISAPSPANTNGGTNITPGFSIRPITGSDAGGTQVIITGAGLTGATRVTFDGVNVQSFIVDSDTQITAISPAHAVASSIDVVVTRVSGGSVVAGNYRYSSIRPSSSGPGSFIYPSPANGPTADIVYVMAEAGVAEIRVYNEIGDLVSKLEDNKPAGQQSSTLNTARLAPGVYFYILNLNYNSGNSDKRRLKKFVVKH